MARQNQDIADTFNKMADLLEIKGENQYRIRAYRNAARTISSLSKNVRHMADEGEDLTKLSGIGKDLAGKIKTLIQKGSLNDLKKLEQDVPSGLAHILDVAGLGGKRVAVIHKELGIKNIEDLKQAAEEHKIRGLEGFGRKTEDKILEEIQRVEAGSGRMELFKAESIAEDLLEYLKTTKGIKDLVIAGSFRRRKETVGDLDILVTHKKGSQVMDRFVNYEGAQKTISKGGKRSSILLKQGLQVDLRAFAQVSYGAALQYFTGSKEHSIPLRKIAVKKKYKINEYGLFRGKKRVAGKTEQSVYSTLGLKYIPPELRENNGEIEAAQQDRLPRLIELKDMRGDLQMHSTASDGHQSIKDMANTAKKIGYDYIAITDHSQKVRVANGLNAKQLKKQIREIDKINKELKGLTILKSCEVDILEDGSLDLPDDVLKELDIVLCSIHSKFGLSRQKQTERMIKAIRHPLSRIIAHPTGRYIKKRAPYDMDMEKVFKAAKKEGTAMEINAHPERLDLKPEHARLAKDMGVKLSISTDAHSGNELNMMHYGVEQARRGWIEADDVINTRSLRDLRRFLKKSSG
ncbi:MAG: DNA polymerase/3'-5' exonuclease PolX [Candidatus Omnitrophota bacterium]